MGEYVSVLFRVEDVRIYLEIYELGAKGLATLKGRIEKTPTCYRVRV
jgi:hypothetical protein